MNLKSGIQSRLGQIAGNAGPGVGSKIRNPASPDPEVPDFKEEVAIANVMSL